MNLLCLGILNFATEGALMLSDRMTDLRKKLNQIAFLQSTIVFDLLGSSLQDAIRHPEKIGLWCVCIVRMFIILWSFCAVPGMFVSDAIQNMMHTTPIER